MFNPKSLHQFFECGCNKNLKMKNYVLDVIGLRYRTHVIRTRS